MNQKLTPTECQEIMMAPKMAEGGFRYKNKTGDYAEGSVAVRCPSMPELNFRLISNYHRSRVPRKMGFVLMLNGQPFFRLDVNPGAFHTNLTTLESVRDTHWHFPPDLKNAVSDARSLQHAGWLGEFLKAATIEMESAYTAPSYEEAPMQLDLLNRNPT